MTVLTQIASGGFISTQSRNLTFVLLSGFLCFISCGPTNYEEYSEFRDLAEITEFSVPDSASATSIPVTISAILGRTTASELWEIDYERTDSLFEFAVFARRTVRSGEQYQAKEILLDTTLVLTTNPPRTGWHYFNIYGYPGVVLTDSCRLY